MSLLNKLCKASIKPKIYIRVENKFYSTNEFDSEKEFQPLNIYSAPTKPGPKHAKTYKKAEVMPPRTTKMPTDQDWPSVWPVSRSFHPATVPLPIYMGYPRGRDMVPPYKYANAELMKIPNFLHLTPPAVERHCQALKQFCTPWPAGLDSDEACDRHFPVEVTTTDFCHAGPSIRDPRSRVVTVKFKVSALPLDYHARDKFIRLAGKERYNPATDLVTIVTDRCPLKKQNYDYSIYCMTALFFESWRVEPWEAYKTRADMEKYFWNHSPSEATIISLIKDIKSAVKNPPDGSYINRLSPECSPEEILKLREVQEYGQRVSELFNTGEQQETLDRYKESVLQLLHLKDPPAPLEGETISN